MKVKEKKAGLYFWLRPCLLFFLFILFSQVTHKKPPLTAYYISGYGQGTTYNITFFAQDSLVTKKHIDSLIAEIDSSLSVYKPYSLISQFNKSTKGVKTDEHLHRVVTKSVNIYHETDGLFDITVYPLVQLWGFGPVKSSATPTPSAIQEILKSVGTDKLRLTRDSLIKALPTLKIDVNGIAQGYTVDLLADLLKSKGITDFLVELGGEIRVEGRKPDSSSFTIGIESPAKAAFDEPVLQKLVSLPKGALTTSGHYRNYRSTGGKSISHLLNPRTGHPLQNELISITVWAPDALTADGYDNALMGMTLPDAFAFAEKIPEVEAYFIYKKTDGTVADTATTGFKKLFLVSY